MKRERHDDHGTVLGVSIFDEEGQNLVGSIASARWIDVVTESRASLMSGPTEWQEISRGITLTGRIDARGNEALMRIACGDKPPYVQFFFRHAGQSIRAMAMFSGRNDMITLRSTGEWEVS
jgi:hypothetical protein